MKKIHKILPLLLVLVPLNLASQPHYEVSRAWFTSSSYDEFCPVILNEQIVFCSNREHELLITYKNRKNRSLFNLFIVDINSEKGPQDPQVFSQNLLTPLNDGPLAFSQDGRRLVYSRNLDIGVGIKNMMGQNNHLGLYFADLRDDEWIPGSAFPYNQKGYSVTTPCFSPDGRYLYFGSDIPGGYGGTDLYRSEQVDGEWQLPVNLGPEINTSGNEVYPFINENGDLYFASDGHGGLGKKDLFISRIVEMEWIQPIHLKAPINSEEDDFGMITDPKFSEGYFSSNRAKTDDIYRFSTLVPPLFACDSLLDNQQCYEFWDEQYPGSDSLPVTYEWEFSDGIKKQGLQVEHCFEGAGKYWAKLNIIDSTTSNIFFTQSSMEFELEDHVQPFIKSSELVVVDSDITFSGFDSNLPGYIIEEYIWDFGDGEYHTGPETDHRYNKPGVYEVKLGLVGSMESSGVNETRCVKKTIRVFPDNQAMAVFNSSLEQSTYAESGNIPANGKNSIRDTSVLEIDTENEVFRVEVLSSDNQLILENPIFDPLRADYQLREFYSANESLYSYTVGEFESLPASYEVYRDVLERGYTSASVKTYVLADLPTREIARINQDFAEFADANFEFNQSEISKLSHQILDQVAEILKENPELELEIAAHTDDIGAFDFNMELSRRRAESIIHYLVSKGIDSSRLMGKGYGESRPISSNNTEDERMMNRRVEFIILNKSQD